MSIFPPLAPIVRLVAAPAKFTVVAVVLTRSNDVLPVVRLVVIAGDVIVGDVSNTNAPEPASPVTAAARFAEDGVARNVATPVPSPLTPVAIGRPVAFVKVTDCGVPSIGEVIVGLVRVLFVRVSVPARVARVPVVGRVTDVVAVAVRVVAKAPEVVKFPPRVIVLPVFATPVPPYWPAIAVPCHVPVAIVPTVAMLSSPV
jgi:hypothetical protein